MKSSLRLLALITLGLSFLLGAETYLVDSESTKVTWTGKKVSSQHVGTIQLSEGSIQFDGGQFLSGKFIMDMTSITNSDVESPKWRSKLEGHLKNDDFFAVDKHPTATLWIDSGKALKSAKENGANYEFSGDLSIRGVTHVIVFDAKVDFKKSQVSAVGTLLVDRTKYGISYKSGKFFQSLGDQAILDEFILDFELTANLEE